MRGLFLGELLEQGADYLESCVGEDWQGCSGPQHEAGLHPAFWHDLYQKNTVLFGPITKQALHNWRCVQQIGICKPGVASSYVISMNILHSLVIAHMEDTSIP